MRDFLSFIRHNLGHLALLALCILTTAFGVYCQMTATSNIPAFRNIGFVWIFLGVVAGIFTLLLLEIPRKQN